MSRTVLTLVVTVFVASSGTSAATAALSDYYTSAGVGNNTFATYIATNINETWRGYVRYGITAWNGTYSSTGTALATTTSSTSIRKAGIGNLPSGWLGSYSYGGTRANRSFQITIDATQIINSPDRTASIGAFAQYASMHEFGHALSLKDNPNTTSTSIMKYRYANWSSPYQSPRTYDIANVASIY